jgi:hypothetical protein
MDEPGWQRSLVDRLVADAGPVRRLWRPEARLAVWLALATVALAVPAAQVARADLALRLRAPAFILEQGLLIVGSVLLGLQALRTVIPGRVTSRALTVAGFAALGLAVLSLVRLPVHHAWTFETFLDVGRPCLWRAAVWGAIPFVVFLLALRRGAPLAQRRVATLAGAATWGVTCVALRVCCQTDELLHLGTFHALPLVGGTLAAAVLGPAALAVSRPT